MSRLSTATLLALAMPTRRSPPLATLTPPRATIRLLAGLRSLGALEREEVGARAVPRLVVLGERRQCVAAQVEAES